MANRFCSYFHTGSDLAKNIPAVDTIYKTFLEGNYITCLLFKDNEQQKEIESITMKLKNKSSSGQKSCSIDI